MLPAAQAAQFRPTTIQQQDAVTVDLNAVDSEGFAEVGGVDHVDLQEEHVSEAGYRVGVALLAFLGTVFGFAAGLAAVGDDVDGLVVGEGVGGRPPVAACDEDGHGEGAEDHRGQDSGGVGAGLSVDVGVQGDGDQDAQGRVDDHDRAYRASPLGGHAVAGQVAMGAVPPAPGGTGRPGREWWPVLPADTNPSRMDAPQCNGDTSALALRCHAPGRPAAARPSGERNLHGSRDDLFLARDHTGRVRRGAQEGALIGATRPR